MHLYFVLCSPACWLISLFLLLVQQPLPISKNIENSPNKIHNAIFISAAAINFGQSCFNIVTINRGQSPTSILISGKVQMNVFYL